MSGNGFLVCFFMDILFYSKLLSALQNFHRQARRTDFRQRLMLHSRKHPSGILWLTYRVVDPTPLRRIAEAKADGSGVLDRSKVHARISRALARTSPRIYLHCDQGYPASRSLNVTCAARRRVHPERSSSSQRTHLESYRATECRGSEAILNMRVENQFLAHK